MLNNPSINTHPDVICPYPGLRPFNEEESIFFRGRETHIEKIISQLEEKKFVMLTGASGDGKSSIVYAGVVPNSRAGSFKAKFNNWLIADFRPERSPIKNMAKAIGTKLGYKDLAFVEKELGFGFSSLINLYKKSAYYLDTSTPEYTSASDIEKKALKRKAANLFIIVDQFEEFFTNLENYNNGKASKDSLIVVNLLLETAKIALAEDLPIYIICTMRSDYVGQCATFRGLPEYIGFSQFFVPRLKRKEIHQVVHEPAQLNGNKIANRLTQTLINEIGEGFDQLPVLQHALNLVWNQANKGKDELDIIHLAKLSGLPKQYLSQEQTVEFNNWFQNVPEFKKAFFTNPSLENVLNAHANELYETAHEYYNNSHEDKITKELAQLIIKSTFQCLTKMDAARSVRNRITLEEITNIIDRKEITPEIVGGVLDIFRVQGNTFIKPFASGEGAVLKLSRNSVLDITHESLIRNWKFLHEWAKVEHENWNTFLDFKKQLQRWLGSNKEKGYLLPSGPLTFFEEWYESCRPNKYWLKKYDESGAEETEKDLRAGKTMEESILFLRMSRSAIRRRRNLLIVATSSIILVLTGFTTFAFLERNTALKQQFIAEQKTSDALKAEQQAIASKNAAEDAQKMATESEHSALLAEDTALVAKEQALHSQKEAEASKLLSESEAKKAEQEKAIAEQESQKAEAQKLIAEQEKNKAETAEQKAKRLSLISLAQNLALKSVLQNDQQLQGLLAMQAYNFTKQNSGQVQDPAIYEALRLACTSLGSYTIIRGSEGEIRTLAESQNASILSAGKNGILNKWDLNTGKSEGTSNFKYTSPIDFVTLDTKGSLLLTGHDDNAVCVWNTNASGTMSPTILKGHKGVVRAAAFSQDETTLVTSGKDGLLIVWSIQSGKSLNTFTIKSDIKTLKFIDKNSVAAITEDGDIDIISINDGSLKNIYSSKTSMPLCCISISRKNIFAVGFSDGKIRLFNMNPLSANYKQLGENTVRIESITANSQGNLLAISCSDKSILIYDLDNRGLKPLRLRDLKSKTRAFAFSSTNKLIVGGEDKTIEVWETSSDKLAEKICPILKRDMTKMEWAQFIGEKVEYQKTCNK